MVSTSKSPDRSAASGNVASIERNPAFAEAVSSHLLRSRVSALAAELAALVRSISSLNEGLSLREFPKGEAAAVNQAGWLLSVAIERVGALVAAAEQLDEVASREEENTEASMTAAFGQHSAVHAAVAREFVQCDLAHVQRWQHSGLQLCALVRSVSELSELVAPDAESANRRGFLLDLVEERLEDLLAGFGTALEAFDRRSAVRAHDDHPSRATAMTAGGTGELAVLLRKSATLAEAGEAWVRDNRGCALEHDNVEAMFRQVADAAQEARSTFAKAMTFEAATLRSEVGHG